MKYSFSINRTLTLAFVVTTSLVIFAVAGESQEAPASNLTISVGNRLYPAFQETHKTNMYNRVYVGDTDYSFEVTGFYPHFAMIDSTKEIVSLSDEPKNVAFKFVVYENDSIVDTSWSFFTIQIPHFARTSYLFFNVLEFEYRGEIFKQQNKDQSQ